MLFHKKLGPGVCYLAVVMISVAAPCLAQQRVEFNSQIRPILNTHCIPCHGPDEQDRHADLRLDSFEEATEYAIVPGSAEDSEVVDRILSRDPEYRMPPAEHGNPLNQTEVDLIKKWIDQGAEYQKHWAFVAPKKPVIPELDLSRFKPVPQINNPIDHFILRRLMAEGYTQNPRSNPRKLIRRVSLDLTGLPPQAHGQETRDSFDEYLHVPTTANYERVVDFLLAEPSFGEHWAAVWLDIARYADTCGYSGDEVRDIWPWRDWLIRSLNSDMSYKDLSIEMLAGDMLPKPTIDQILATAFHRNTLSNNEGGTDNEEFRTIAVKDRLSTTMNTWMGLTVRCAECHSHKYDPISHTEYHQLLDFFNQTVDADDPDDRPRLAIARNQTKDELTAINDQIESLENTATEESEEIAQQLKQLIKQRDAASIRVPVMQERKKRRQTHVMLRGNYRSTGEKVSAKFPDAFSCETSYPLNRLGLANWLFDDDNPITARVAVNRYWSRLMGIGIVETEEDFGTQGTPPTHPELLDYLANQFRDSDWNTKQLLKTIVMSATYQQSQRAEGKGLEKDPRNRLLSRGPRNRLSAEVVRDQALAVSGLLSNKMYGEPVFPPNPVKKVANAFRGDWVWHESEGEDRYRRSIYTFIKRSSPHPLFETFDVASRDVCSLRRLRTNTPLQSFMTLNDISFVEAARALAGLMMQSDDGEKQTLEEQIRKGVERALFSEATGEQLTVFIRLYQNNLPKFEHDLANAAVLVGRDPGEVDSLSDAEKSQLAGHAAMTLVANVILNLDSFLNN